MVKSSLKFFKELCTLIAEWRKEISCAVADTAIKGRAGNLSGVLHPHIGMGSSLRPPLNFDHVLTKISFQKDEFLKG